VKNSFQQRMIIFNIIVPFFILVVFGMTVENMPCALCTISYWSVYLKVGGWEVISVLLCFL